MSQRLPSFAVVRITFCSICILLACSTNTARSQVVFEVTTTAPTGAGSLLEAINNANSQAGADTIKFNISGVGPHIIEPTGPLPDIDDPVVIDGFSQPGSSPNTNSITEASNAVLMIGLDGSSAGIQNGIVLKAGNSVVRGLAIYNFDIGGIQIDSPGGNHISGCYVGTDITGLLARPNANHGVAVVSGADDLLGGLNPEDRNVISGNGWVGVAVIGVNTIGTVVQGNFIGLDANGTAALGNGQHGVNAGRAATGTVASQFVIGGTELEARNVISSNSWSGILVIGEGADDFLIAGNYIGTDRTGSVARGNSIGGIDIALGPANGVVGGAGSTHGNLIAANVSNGIACQQDCDNMVIQGNIIGTDPSGTADLGNGIDGIVVVDSDNALVGGSASGEGNVVGNSGRIGIYSFGSNSGTHVIEGNFVGTNRDETSDIGNTDAGVRLEWVGHTVRGNYIANNSEGIVVLGSGHRLTQNSIYSNDGIGIDLGFDGRSVNDAGDADTGNNNMQNYPEISDVGYDAGANEVSVTYQVPSTTTNSFYPLTVEFFVSDDGEGRRYIGSDTYTGADYTTGPSKQYSFAPVAGVSASDKIVATAIDSGGQTSEFSDVTVSLPLEEESPSYADFRIRSVYPNPATSHATMVFEMPESGHVRVEILDLLGRVQSATFNGAVTIGTQDISLDVRNIASGLYFVRIAHEERSTTRPLVVQH